MSLSSSFHLLSCYSLHYPSFHHLHFPITLPLPQSISSFHFSPVPLLLSLFRPPPVTCLNPPPPLRPLSPPLRSSLCPLDSFVSSALSSSLAVGALWFRTVRTGPLARLFAHSLTPLTHLLAPHCLLHLFAPPRSFAHSLTHWESE